MNALRKNVQYKYRDELTGNTLEASILEIYGDPGQEIVELDNGREYLADIFRGMIIGNTSAPTRVNENKRSMKNVDMDDDISSFEGPENEDLVYIPDNRETPNSGPIPRVDIKMDKNGFPILPPEVEGLITDNYEEANSTEAHTRPIRKIQKSDPVYDLIEKCKKETVIVPISIELQMIPPAVHQVMALAYDDFNSKMIDNIIRQMDTEEFRESIKKSIMNHYGITEPEPEKEEIDPA